MGPPQFFLEGAPAVRRLLVADGWEPTNRWDFALWWRRQVPSRSVFVQLPPGARINHLPGIAALASPARLGSSLDRARTLARRPGAPGVPTLAPSDAPHAGAVECLVLIAGVDPLRLHVRVSGPDGIGAEPTRGLREAIHRLVIATVAAAYDEMVRGVRDAGLDRAACFELLRFDLSCPGGDAVDLVRCVLSPSLDEAVAADVLAVLGLVAARAPTRFEQLAPIESGADFVHCCPWPRWSDVAAAGLLDEGLRVGHRAASRVFGGAVVLFQESSSRFHVLNDTAGYVWVRTREGASPSAVAEELAKQFGLDGAKTRGDVWDALARWASDGWIGVAGVPEAPGPRFEEIATERARCRLGQRGVVLELSSGRVVALVGRESSGASAIAAVLAARGEARIVNDTLWLDEASGGADVGPARLAVFESDDPAVAALCPAFAASPHEVAASEIGIRWFEPPSWRDPPPVVDSVIVVRRARRGAATEVLRLAPRDALLALTGLGMSAEPPWTTERALGLLDWLDDTPALLLLSADVVTAADALLALGPSP